MRRLSTIAIAAVLTIACDQGGAARDTGDAQGEQANAGTSAGQGAPAAPSGEPAIALGLSRIQLEDADLLNASGVEIGEIERVVTDASGNATGLLVEIEDTDPDRYVTIPLDGLSTMTSGHDVNLKSSLTREQLMKMPETQR